MNEAQLGKSALRALVTTTMQALGDEAEPKSRAWWHYNFVLRELGRETTEELVIAVRLGPMAAPTAPTWLKDDGSPRSKGGVFFALARQRLSKSKWGRASWLADDCFKRSRAKAVAT